MAIITNCHGHLRILIENGVRVFFIASQATGLQLKLELEFVVRICS